MQSIYLNRAPLKIGTFQVGVILGQNLTLKK